MTIPDHPPFGASRNPRLGVWTRPLHPVTTGVSLLEQTAQLVKASPPDQKANLFESACERVASVERSVTLATCARKGLNPHNTTKHPTTCMETSSPKPQRSNMKQKLMIGIIAGCALVAPPGLQAQGNGTWTQAVSGGLFSTPGNWSEGAVPGGTGSTADFNSLDITADHTLHLDSAQTFGSLIFGDTDLSSAASWTLDNNANAANILTLDNFPGLPTITVNGLGAGKVATVSAAISGLNGFIKEGAGRLVLATNNSYAGTTVVNQGFIQVTNLNNSLGIGNNQPVVLNGGAIAAWFSANVSPLWPINVDTNGGEIDLLATSSSGRWSFTGNTLTGSGVLTLKPQGTRFLMASQPGFSGKWILDGANGTGGGIVSASFDNQFGAPGDFVPDLVTMKNNVSLQSANPPPGPLGNSGLLGITIGSGGGTFAVAGANQFIVQAPIASTGRDPVTFLANANNAGVQLNSVPDANSYSGNTVLANTGIAANFIFLRLGGNEVIPNGTGKGVVAFTGSPGTLDLNGYNETINGFGTTSSSTVIDNMAGFGNDGTGNSTLAVGDADTNSVFGGIIKNTFGTVNLIKIGAGTLTLTNANTYGGFTVVSNGTLALRGIGSVARSTAILMASNTAVLDISGLSNASLTLSSTQTLAGIGTILGSVSVPSGASVRVGDPGGTLTVTNALALGGPLAIQLDATGASGCLNVGGSLTLSNTLLNLAITNGPLTGEAYVIARYGSLNGAFSSLSTLPNGYVLNYAYQQTNQIALTTLAAGAPRIASFVGPTNQQCGDTALFQVALVSGNSPSYQWFIDGTAVWGETTPTLVLTDVHSAGGVYNVSVQIANASGSVTTNLTMRVVDTVAPTITINGPNEQFLNVGDTFTDPGASALDGCMSAVAVRTSGTVNTGAPGTYNVVYTADDGNGNTNHATLVVHVNVAGAPGVWISRNSGLWSGATNWANGLIPFGTDTTADFSQTDPDSDVAVHLKTPVTVAQLIFGDTNLSSAAGWTLDNNGDSTAVLTLQGTTKLPSITVNALGTGKVATVSVQLEGYSGLIKNGAGTLVLGTSNQYWGTTIINQGAIRVTDITNTLGAVNSQPITLNGGAIAAALSQEAIAVSPAWPIYVDANGGEIDLLATNSYGRWSFTADTLTGSGTLTLKPKGTRFQLASQPNFSGKWILDGTNRAGGGIVHTPSDACFGSPSAFTSDAVTLLNNVTLQSMNPPASPLGDSGLLGITIGDGGGTFKVAGANVYVIQAPIAGTAAAPVTFAADNNFSGILLSNGPAVNSYSGNTVIANTSTDGNTVFLRLGGDEVIPDGPGKGLVAFSGVNAVLDLNGHNETINGFGAGTNSSAVNNITAGGNSTLTVGNANTTSSFAGTIRNSSGTVGLTKIGTGTLTLSGANTYSGATTVSNGALLMTTSHSGGGDFTLADGTTLGVTNTQNTAGAAMANLTLGNSGPTAVTLQNVASTTVPVINALGTVTLNGACNITIADKSNLITGNNYPLIKYGSLAGAGRFTLSLPPNIAGNLVTNTANSSLDLNITSALSLTPTNLVGALTGNTLTLSWPADHLGWQLQTNAVSVAATNQWFAYPGSSAVTSEVITINPSKVNVFYRLVYPPQ